MATIGRTSVGSGPRALNASIKGLEIVMAEDGQAGVSIWAYVEDSATGDQFGCVIMSGANDGTVLANSAVRTDISTAGWYEFTGGDLGSFTPSDGTTYILAVASLSAANANVYNDDAGLVGFTGSSSVTGLNPLTMSGTMVLASDAARDYSIYMEYTTGGGEAARVFPIRA